MRTLFRHSVVPGGVLTADEVETAMGRDGIVAAHYSAINPSELRVETLPQDRAVYMSYRIGDEVFWTKQKVWLRQGETILTDGAHQIRTRCGNCIAFAPMAPTSDDEPGEMEFDALTDEAGVVRSRNPLGSELLFGPVGGIPLSWFLGNSSAGFAGNESTGGQSIGIPVWYAADPTESGLSDDDLVLFPLIDDEPASPGFEPADGPFTNPPPRDPHDPANPEQPDGTGNPGVPVVPGEHEVPLNPILPPLENPVVPAPEPATLLLIGGGLITFFARRQRL